MKLKTEQKYPLVAAVVVLALVYVIQKFGWWSAPATIKDLFAAVVNISAITVGFLAATKSILFTIDDRPIMRRIKMERKFKPLVNYMISAVKWSLALAGFTSLLLLCNASDLPYLFKEYLAIWAALVAGAGFSCYRVIGIMALVLDSLGNLPPPQLQEAPPAPTTPLQ